MADPILTDVYEPMPAAPMSAEPPQFSYTASPYNYRVDLSTNPWPEHTIHCPGLVARYTISSQTTRQYIYTLQIQTWSGIYKCYKFHLRNLVHTCLEMNNNNYTIRLIMKNGGSIILMFESLEDLERAHDYLFEQLGR
jgi:hypothetical protein